MKKHLHRLGALIVFVLTTVAISALPPIYMKYGDIKGEVTPSSGQKGWIEIESISLGTSPTLRGNPVQGNLIGTDAAAMACTKGPLKFSVRGPAAEEVKKSCQSRKPLGTITIDADGVRHILENASFASCQNGDGTIPTDQFSLNYTSCATHRGGVRVAVGDVNGDGAASGNARLIGLSSGPVSIRLEALELSNDGTSAKASLTKLGPGPIVLPPSNSKGIPQVVFELDNGTKWTFTKVVFSDIVISGVQSPTTQSKQSFTLKFEKVEGPAGGYPRR